MLEKMRLSRTAGPRELIGHVGVDSGQVMIVDPRYVTGGESYQAVCESTQAEMQLQCESGGSGRVVAHRTVGGDGYFPVFAEHDENGHRCRLIIELEATGFDEPRLG